jgi:DNA replicative helicase MCM subunit Mcm2 (Cdc46/Mcm family)
MNAAILCMPALCCSVQENLKLSPAMLSRFDLIFVLLDRPDELMDQALSEHIMALHSGKAVACKHYSWPEATCRA